MWVYEGSTSYKSRLLKENYIKEMDETKGIVAADECKQEMVGWYSM